jgi:hypothetical protein
MAGADDTATLQLLVEVREGLANVNLLATQYQAALQRMQAATAAGTAKDSAEFRALQADALGIGQKLEAASVQGVASMNALAAATGKPIAEAEVLERQLVELRGQLKVLQTEGSGGLNIIGANVDTLGTKFSKLSKGLLAGFALGPVVGVISLLTEALGKALEKLQEFAVKQLAGGDSTAKLTENTRSLTDSLQRLAEREDRLSQSQAEQISKQIDYRLTTDQVRTAIEAHNAAIAAADAAFAKNTAEGASLEQRRVAIYEKTVALRAADEAYALALQGTTDALQRNAEATNAATDRRLALYNSIRGGGENLEQEKNDLLLVIEQVERHGLVSQQVHERIAEQLKAEVALFDEWGKALPADLLIAANAYGVLSEAQQRSADAFKRQQDLVQQGIQKNLAELQGGGKDADAQKRVDTLKREVAALEQQNDAAVVSIDQSEALFAKKEELADAEIALNRATLDSAAALDTQAAAASNASSNLQETYNQLRLARGEIDQFGNEVGTAADVCEAGFEGIGAAALAGADGVGQQTSAIGELSQQSGKAAVDADKLSKVLDGLGKAGEDGLQKNAVSGEALNKALGDANAGVLTIEEAMVRITDVRMRRLVEVTREWTDLLGGQLGAVD